MLTITAIEECMATWMAVLLSQFTWCYVNVLKYLVEELLIIIIIFVSDAPYNKFTFHAAGVSVLPFWYYY